MKEYLSSFEDVLKEQHSSPDGLSTQEAEKRLEQLHKEKREQKTG